MTKLTKTQHDNLHAMLTNPLPIYGASMRRLLALGFAVETTAPEGATGTWATITDAGRDYLAR
jgi:hypothetical protein